MADDLRKAAVLVAADNAEHAGPIAKRLEQDFDNVHVNVSEANACRDYEAVSPVVIVLAFQDIEQSEHFMLGLLRSCPAAQSKRCRTIVLCSKEEVPRAFECCKKGYFDEYVLYWPMAFDGMRLSMSVWVACRDGAMARLAASAVPTDELFAHVRHVDSIEGELNRSLSADQRARLEPHMAQVRNLTNKVRKMRLLMLVVEDDELAFRLIERALHDQPVDLIFAPDGKSALLELRKRRPQVILMDVRLPGMDGVMLTRAIKATREWCEIPIVMLTGSAQRETVTASMAAGAESFLVKPVNRDALIGKLRQFLPPPAPGQERSGTPSS